MNQAPELRFSYSTLPKSIFFVFVLFQRSIYDIIIQYFWRKSKGEIGENVICSYLPYYIIPI